MQEKRLTREYHWEALNYFSTKTIHWKGQKKKSEFWRKENFSCFYKCNVFVQHAELLDVGEDNLNMPFFLFSFLFLQMWCFWGSIYSWRLARMTWTAGRVYLRFNVINFFPFLKSDVFWSACIAGGWLGEDDLNSSQAQPWSSMLSSMTDTCRWNADAILFSWQIFSNLVLFCHWTWQINLFRCMKRNLLKMKVIKDWKVFEFSVLFSPGILSDWH